jgi:SAM-dependent methyltransferase
MGSEATYSPDQFAPLFAVEDRHFWFRGRNRCIAAALKSVPDFDRLTRVLEVGCGTGVVLAELERLFPAGEITGMDLFEEALAFARRRFKGTLVQGDVCTHAFHTRFDVVCACDVIEHLDDDGAVLAHLRNVLREGGYLLITVPAHQGLWSYFDEVAHHRRRYDRDGLTRTLESAGFVDIYVTEFMAALFPLMWLKRRLVGGRMSRLSDVDSRQKQSAAESDLHVGRLQNWLLSLAVKPEAYLVSRRAHMPIGTSLLALARRPSETASNV